MTYTVIYDATCNLCTTLVRSLQQLDRAHQFVYVPMQDPATLATWGITPEQCELGMIVIDNTTPANRWQGSDAAEEIARLLPGGAGLVMLYRSLPGLKWLGDRVYAQVRDNRYQWFGRCDCAPISESKSSSGSISA